MYTIRSTEFEGARIATYVGESNIDFEFANNLFEVFEEGVLRAGKGRFLGHIDNGGYQWQTYEDTLNRVRNFGSGLRALGFEPRTAFGLMSLNRPEWVIGEYGCFHQNLVTVPIYETFGEGVLEHIVNQTGMEVLLTTSEKAQLLPSKEVLPTLKTIILIDRFDTDVHDNNGRHLLSMNAVENMGANKPSSRELYSRSETATICYTSGTTGKPKGVVLTHGNFIAEIASIRFASINGMFYNASPDDIHLSYLPLAHVFERVIQGYLISQGAQIGFYGGDPQKIIDDLSLLKPTIFASVPRIFNRIYNKVWEEVDKKGRVVSCLFRKAYEHKKRCIMTGSASNKLIDKVFFEKVAMKLGGNVKVILSGSAPLRKDVSEFLRTCFTTEVYEGYGLTETCAGATLTLKPDPQGGHVGVPFACGVVKIDKDTGEVLVKGKQVFAGYYNEPELTRAAFAHGWYRSGDLGKWDDQGRLVITGRIKDTFKLSQGEFISPDKIEGILCKSARVANVYVYGDSSEHYLVAVVVPAAPPTDEATFKAELLSEFEKLGKANGLKGFEIPKRVHIELEPFTVENDLLTPTMKLKRHVAKERFSEQIKAMYLSLSGV